MSGMFSNCYNLGKVNLNSFNTKNVLSMNSMFYNCTSLTSLNFTSFNTLKCEYFENMFASCKNIEIEIIKENNINLISKAPPNILFIDVTL